MLQILVTIAHIITENQIKEFNTEVAKVENISAIEEKRLKEGKEKLNTYYSSLNGTAAPKKEVDVLQAIQDELKNRQKLEASKEEDLDINALNAMKEEFRKKSASTTNHSSATDADLQKINLTSNPLEPLKEPETSVTKINPAEVKIDITSKLDNKAPKKESESKIPESVPLETIDKDTSVNSINKISEETKPNKDSQVPNGTINEDNTKEVLVKKDEESILTKVKNFIINSGEKAKEAIKSTVSKEPDKQVNSDKPKPISKKDIIRAQEKERLAKLNEKRRQQELLQAKNYQEKLNRLRAKYLTNSKKEELSEDEDTINNSTPKNNPSLFELEDTDEYVAIKPKKKTYTRFIEQGELPPPLTNRFQSNDNRHHPFIANDSENINLLLESINYVSDIAYFNALYQKINNPNLINNKGDTILINAILLQRQDIVESILSNGADPDMPNKLGYRPLNVAIELNDLRVVKILLRAGADAKYIDPLGRTYLMQAAGLGFLSIIDNLIENGAEINILDSAGNSALSIAYRYRKDVVAKYLLKKGAKTWVENSYSNPNQLMIKELERRWE